MCIVVGADRVAANGDTANKIGTYSLAVLAKYHGVKFLVAAPRTTIDLSTASGSDIIIEERPTREVTNIKGPEVQISKDGSTSHGAAREISVAAAGTRAWNPSFDVTPAELIDGIVTEVGVVERGSNGQFALETIFVDSSSTLQDKNPASTSPLLPNDNPDISMSWDKVLGMKADEVRPWASWLNELG